MLAALERAQDHALGKAVLLHPLDRRNDAGDASADAADTADTAGTVDIAACTRPCRRPASRRRSTRAACRHRGEGDPQRSTRRRQLRYMDALDDLREHAQLIIITHQQRTMAIADALCGITMRADGVSAAISQRLERHG
ncbi:hypothetical protein [Bifidobacterium boum]|uniref:hypothetical protein n=1 Tax=Bifidobacterium boum TaxID=78343 RepID=UPI003C6C8BE7